MRPGSRTTTSRTVRTCRRSPRRCRWRRRRISWREARFATPASRAAMSSACSRPSGIMRSSNANPFIAIIAISWDPTAKLVDLLQIADQGRTDRHCPADSRARPRRDFDSLRARARRVGATPTNLDGGTRTAPFSPKQIAIDRIRAIVHHRTPFVVTSDYIGPDRRDGRTAAPIALAPLLGPDGDRRAQFTACQGAGRVQCPIHCA